MALGSTLALIGQIASKGMAANNQANQYNQLASIADLNAGLMEVEGQYVVADAEYMAKRMERQGQKFVATQMARYYKSGVTFEGSPMKVVQETEKNIRQDIIMTRYNAVREANRLGFQGVNQRISASSYRSAAGSSRTSGLLDMATTFAISKWG